MALREHYEIAVGDTVLYKRGYRGEYRPATVLKIGPKNVWLQDGRDEILFRRDGQDRTDGHAGHFVTLEQHTDRTDRERATKDLARHGIEVRHRVHWSTEQLALLAMYADTVHPWPEQTEEKTA